MHTPYQADPLLDERMTTEVVDEPLVEGGTSVLSRGQTV